MTTFRQPLGFNVRRDNAILRDAVYRVLETATQPMTVRDIHQKVMRLGTQARVRVAVDLLRQRGDIEVVTLATSSHTASTYCVVRTEADCG